jgi:hypothetical protein
VPNGTALIRLLSGVCPLSSLVEHFLGKEEVVGPIPTGGSVAAAGTRAAGGMAE